MINIGLKMLIGDRPKYIGLVFGITFATLLISQQVSIFLGLMARTASIIYSISEVDIWVMDSRVLYIDDLEPLRDIELTNVRSISGVEWAVPFYKGLNIMRMPKGRTQQVQLLGIDDVSLIGACSKMVKGKLNSIRQPNNGIIDVNGYHFIWPHDEIKTGQYIELNDHRLILNGVCETNPPFLTFPIVYVTYNTALEMTPPQRNRMSYILVKAKPGQDINTLKKAISDETDLQVLTSEEFAWRSINYYLFRTGIAINFSITIMLGIIIGGAITAQTFYMFISENLKQFAAMKAIGMTNKQLFNMVATQALLVYVIGYGFGIGLTALFFSVTQEFPSLKGYTLHWQVMLCTAVLIGLIILCSIIFGIRKVFNVDPAVVFRG